MKADDKARLVDLYEQRFRVQGANLATLGWNSPADQELRFAVLADIGNLKDKTVCDVGCGFGDLLPYLENRFPNVVYTGIDLAPSLVEEARRRYRRGRFLLLDILEDRFDERFDYLLLSGALSFRISNNLAHTEAVMRRMFELCDEGIGLNFLTTYVNFQREHNYHHKPEEVFAMARTLTPWVSLRHDYPLWEFTIFLYKHSRQMINFSMNPILSFQQSCVSEIQAAGDDEELKALSLRWMHASARYKYTYHFSSLGRPVIQFPQDIVAMQELIWRIKPDLIIETGIAHGGSLVASASALALLDYCDAVQAGRVLDPRSTRRRVLGIDIEIRPHNRAAIEEHPMAHRIDMIQGSSIASDVVAQVHEIAKGYERVLVCLDSDHTREHVLAELEAYAPLVSPDSYCVVFDTVIEQAPDGMFPNRPWGRGNSPMAAVQIFLSLLESADTPSADGQRLFFEVDSHIDAKLLISTAQRGYLRRVPRLP